jgi:hypothetical protein
MLDLNIQRRPAVSNPVQAGGRTSGCVRPDWGSMRLSLIAAAAATALIFPAGYTALLVWAAWRTGSARALV